MRLAFTPEAASDAETIDAWWRERHVEVPTLFAEELQSVCAEILSKPPIMQPCGVLSFRLIRRWLLRRTEHHIYYAFNMNEKIVTVLRIWGARHGNGPRV